MPFSPNDSFVVTRQLSVVSSEGGECPNKMSTKRRVCEKKPAEPPAPRKNANEKLIQAETTETGTVWFDSPLPFSTIFFCLEKKKIPFILTFDPALLNMLYKSQLQALGFNLVATAHSY